MRLLRLVFIVEMHSQPPLTCRRYMAEILPIQRKLNLIHQSPLTLLFQ